LVRNLIDKIILEDIQQILRRIKPEAFKDVDILVTGGGGFIGSYLCDTLVKSGADVTCLDNFSTGLEANVNHLYKMKNFRIITEDVCDFRGNERFDYILHFASRPSPEEYQLNPVKTLLSNSHGSYRMLELARRHNSRILFASSSEVYGDAQVIPTPESYWGHVNPVGPRSCYDEGKRYGEALFMAYHREFNLDVRIARIHNTYGPRLRSDGFYARALSRFVLQALRGEDLTVYGDGNQTRSFCYITDTVIGVLLMLCSPKCDGEVINIGSNDETRILDLANKIQGIVGGKSKIAFLALPQDDPLRRQPDISKAKKLLGWQFSVGLDDGIRRTVDWFRSTLNS
jgi:UDP-glucuronate decarboxylase